MNSDYVSSETPEEDELPARHALPNVGVVAHITVEADPLRRGSKDPSAVRRALRLKRAADPGLQAIVVLLSGTVLKPFWNRACPTGPRDVDLELGTYEVVISGCAEGSRR